MSQNEEVFEYVGYAGQMRLREENEKLKKRIKEDYRIIEFQEDKIADLHRQLWKLECLNNKIKLAERI